MVLRFNCRICKKITDHRTYNDTHPNLPPGLMVVGCISCGVLGVQMIDTEETIKDA